MIKEPRLLAEVGPSFCSMRLLNHPPAPHGHGMCPGLPSSFRIPALTRPICPLVEAQFTNAGANLVR
jgi:hypothetical protein